jgi:DNA-binding response OmpR family regulator
MLDELRQQLNPPSIASESRRLHCFVVDDDADVRRFMASSLRRSGLHAQDYRSIEEMDTALSEGHPDLIFLDVWLDGSDAVDAIRVLERHRYEGYVQLISGRDTSMVENVRRLGKGRQLHMLPVLQKPFRPAEIRNIIHEVNSRYAKAQVRTAGPSCSYIRCRPQRLPSAKRSNRAGWSCGISQSSTSNGTE